MRHPEPTAEAGVEVGVPVPPPSAAGTGGCSRGSGAAVGGDVPEARVRVALLGGQVATLWWVWGHSCEFALVWGAKL